MELNFIKTPFIPNRKVKLMLIDGRTPETILDKLSSFGIDFILTEKCDSVSPALSYHPDIQVHPLGNDKIIVCPEMYNYYCKKLEPYCFEVICGEHALSCNYPNDIAYNIARISNICFHNFKYADKLLYEFFIENSLTLANVKQGYTKCSTAIISKNSIITSDKGIHNTALEKKIDSLLIAPGYINLKNHNYGFIGGCTGLIASDLLAVTGSLEKHPDFNKIKFFLEKYKIEIIFLSDKEPIDLGSLIPLMESAK